MISSRVIIKSIISPDDICQGRIWAMNGLKPICCVDPTQMTHYPHTQAPVTPPSLLGLETGVTWGCHGNSGVLSNMKELGLCHLTLYKFNPFMPRVPWEKCPLNQQNFHKITHSCMYKGPKTARLFLVISLQQQRIIRKYLKEKHWSKSNTQLSFKYFVNLWLITKLFSKVSNVQTTLVKKFSWHERVKHRFTESLKNSCSVISDKHFFNYLAKVCFFRVRCRYKYQFYKGWFRHEFVNEWFIFQNDVEVSFSWCVSRCNGYSNIRDKWMNEVNSHFWLMKGWEVGYWNSTKPTFYLLDSSECLVHQMTVYNFFSSE